jgi:hypothetical protein
MPIPLPQLDDRSYEQLLADAQALIPALYPSWTNHNPSDPGITLIELFAFLTEQLIYRTDQITDADRITFLRLLNGPEWELQGDLDLAIRTTISGLRERYRAVTTVDYEQLILTHWSTGTAPAASGTTVHIQRAKAFPRRDFSRNDRQARLADAPGHMSLIIVAADSSDGALLQPSADLIEAITVWLDERRLLGTRHQIIGPEYLGVRLQATLTLQDGADPALLRQSAVTQLRRFCDPLHGGEDGKGWPFGRDIYVSEIYQLLDQVAGVDTVHNVQLSSTEAGRRLAGADGALVGLQVDPWELVALRIESGDLEIREAER